jgi:hypothetical protein
MKEESGEFEIQGVQKVTQVETEFLSTKHTPGKISHMLDIIENKLAEPKVCKNSEQYCPDLG